MSIYRGWRSHYSYSPEVRSRDTDDIPAKAAPVPLHLRKAQPAESLLPSTRTWLMSLPENYRPRALAARYARIANNLAAAWNTPAECRAYFDDLLIDRRGGRRGFPPEVLRELTRLQSAYEALRRMR